MTFSPSCSARYAVVAATVAVLAAGCGSSSSGGSAAGSTGGSQAVAPAASGSNATLSTHTTNVGKVLADPNGHTLYELVGDTAANSKCASACQSIWPPVTAAGKIKVVHGHPVFTFTGDSAAGQANGEGTKDTWGTWLALTPGGQPIAPQANKTPVAAKTSAPASSGGGYGY